MQDSTKPIRSAITHALLLTALLLLAGCASMVAGPAPEADQGVTALSTSGAIVYDAVPDPLPSSLVSLGYQATQTREFGQAITFDGAGELATVTITMVSFACESGAWNLGTCETTPGATFQHPITVNLYAIDEDDLTLPGSLLASVTQIATIPYRPSVDLACPANTDHPKIVTAWLDASGACNNGLAHNVPFDFSGEGVTLPASLVFGVAYNTQTYGAEPIGVTGPYDSLNVGLVDNGPDVPRVGTAGNAFWDGGGSSGLSGFEWIYTVPARFETALPQPSTISDCKKNGWKAFGFRNQGQCIRYVNTGKDSR